MQDLCRVEIDALAQYRKSEDALTEARLAAARPADHPRFTRKQRVDYDAAFDRYRVALAGTVIDPQTGAVTLPDVPVLPADYDVNGDVTAYSTGAYVEEIVVTGTLTYRRAGIDAPTDIRAAPRTPSFPRTLRLASQPAK